jgi:hypothetical protein
MDPPSYSSGEESSSSGDIDAAVPQGVVAAATVVRCERRYLSLELGATVAVMAVHAKEMHLIEILVATLRQGRSMMNIFRERGELHGSRSLNLRTFPHAAVL